MPEESFFALFIIVLVGLVIFSIFWAIRWGKARQAAFCRRA